MQGEFTGLAHPVWAHAVGLWLARRTARAFVEFAVGRVEEPARPPGPSKSRCDELMIIAGTPKQVIAKLRILLEETRPGILGSGAMTAPSRTRTPRPASG